MVATPESLIRPEIHRLSAYRVADAQGLIKLDAMENPYVWPPELVEDWLAGLRKLALNRYPDPQAKTLKRQLRDRMGIASAAGLILGNGSDELIQLVALALARPGQVLLAPEPSFSMYRMIADFVGMDYVGVPLRASDFALDVEAMMAAMQRYQPAVVFFAYPNNPTGNRFDPAGMHRLIAAAPGLVVVDEAYFAFAEHSFLGVLEEYNNLLVMRTLSKMGLAGLRLGLLVGAQSWLDEMEKLRLPYNINVLSQASGEFALQHWDVFEQQTQRIRQDRTMLLAGLRDLPGITVFPSETNFILFRAPSGEGDRVFVQLREAGVLIKNLNTAAGLLQDCLRVTVGTPEENRAFLAALAVIL